MTAVSTETRNRLVAQGFTREQVESVAGRLTKRKAYMDGYNKEYRLDPIHLEREKELHRKHSETNEVAAARWRRLHPKRTNEIRTEATERWRREHPEAYQAYKRNQNAARKGAVGSFTASEWELKLDEYGHRCAYCGILAEDTPECRLTPDHVIPIAYGGENDISNIVPACRHCNNAKGTKTVDEFLAGISDEAAGGALP